MKTYTIKINRNNNNSFNFRNLNNASKNLDDLIIAGLTKMNPYLRGTKNIGTPDPTLNAMLAEAGFDTDDHIIISNRDNSYLLKDNSIEFAKAAKFLSNYTPIKKYYLYDETPIEFFEDEIQIGSTLIPLYKLSDSRYYRTFDRKTKNIIINLFITINR